MIEWERPSLERVRGAETLQNLASELWNATQSNVTDHYGLSDERYLKYKEEGRIIFEQLLEEQRFGGICCEDLEYLYNTLE